VIKATKQLSELNEQLNFIDLEIDNSIKKCEKAVEIILISIANLKKISQRIFLKQTLKKFNSLKKLNPNSLPN
jgi:hypothetical protein